MLDFYGEKDCASDVWRLIISAVLPSCPASWEDCEQCDVSTYASSRASRDEGYECIGLLAAAKTDPAKIAADHEEERPAEPLSIFDTNEWHLIHPDATPDKYQAAEIMGFDKFPHLNGNRVNLVWGAEGYYLAETSDQKLISVDAENVLLPRQAIVRVDGLLATPELNGTVCTIIDFFFDRGLYLLKQKEGTEKILGFLMLKPQNITPATPLFSPSVPIDTNICEHYGDVTGFGNSATRRWYESGLTDLNFEGRDLPQSSTASCEQENDPQSVMAFESTISGGPNSSRVWANNEPQSVMAFDELCDEIPSLMAFDEPESHAEMADDEYHWNMWNNEQQPTMTFNEFQDEVPSLRTVTGPPEHSIVATNKYRHRKKRKEFVTAVLPSLPEL